MMSWVTTIQTEFESKINKGQLVLKVCPFCGNEKWNLEFNIQSRVFHCWVCDFSGSVDKFLSLNNLSSEVSEFIVSAKKIEPKKSVLTLQGFKQFDCREYPKFCLAKGIEPDDAVRFNLLVSSENKEFAGYLVMPLFEGKKLVFLVGRELAVKGKYHNLKIDKLDILPYYLGKNDKYTIYLVEGCFDAMSINKLGYSTGILLGTHITYLQIKKLRDFGFKKIVVTLDGDVKKKAIQLCKEISYYGLDCYITEFPVDKDPNDLYVTDRSKLKGILENFRKFTVEDEVSARLNNHENYSLP